MSTELTLHAQADTPLVWEIGHSRILSFSAEYVQSRMDVHDPDALQLEYTRTMMGFLLAQASPRSIAMIGLGGGSLAKYCHRYLPQTRIDAIEISADVIALRDVFGIPPDSERFFIHHADGAEFLHHCDSEFDVILADGFDSHGLPEALSTIEFFTDCRNALTPSGLLVNNLHSCSRDYSVVVERIARVFDDAVSLVRNSNSSNRIAFAAGSGLDGLRALCNLRCPADFDRSAWKKLLPSMAQVVHDTRDMFYSERLHRECMTDKISR